MQKDWTKDWFTAAELLQMSSVERKKNSIDNLCPEGQGMILFGPESSLKSSTAIELALAMTVGDLWYGIESKPLKSLYVFFEGEPGELGDKLRRALKKYPHADLDNIIFRHFDDLALDTDAGKKKLDLLILSLPWYPDCIFFDPYRECIEGDENPTTPAKQFLKNVNTYKSRKFIIHHRAKPGKEFRTLGEMIRGSAALAQWAHTTIGYFPQGEDASLLKFRSRGARPDSFVVKIGADGILQMEQPTWTPYSKVEKAELEVWNLLDESYRTEEGVKPKRMTVGDLEQEVTENTKVGRNNVKLAWQNLVAAGLVKEETEGKHKLLYISPWELEPSWPIK